MSSLITIVIPVYNREVTLLRTLRSIESQSVAPAEVILVDNGSTDGSPELMRQWMAGRPNVRVVHVPLVTEDWRKCARNLLNFLIPMTKCCLTI